MVMNINKPIIVIGAGRSGTTLLTNIFAKHPDIDFRGETFFLVPRLWLEMWEDRFWFNWQLYTDTNPRSAREKFPEVPNGVLVREESRIGIIIAEEMVNLLKVNRKSKQIWGFKEIWNGSSQFKYDWTPYDEVFPEAIWVHIVRNPFDFALSTANWNRDILDINYLYNRLLDWVSMVRYSRERADTGRYFEIRYEKLVQNARSVVEPILKQVKIAWHPNCEEASKQFVLRSKSGSRSKKQTETSLKEKEEDLSTLIATVEGLPELLSEFDYKIPETLLDHLVTSDQVQADQAAFVNLHDVQNQNISRFHKPQYLWQQLYEQMNQKYYAAEQLSQQLSAEVSQLTENVHHLTGQNGFLSEENRKANESNRQLSEQAMQLTEQRTQLAEQNQHFITQVHQLTDQNRQLMAQYQQLMDHDREVLDQNHQLIEQGRQLTEQNQQLMKNNTQLTEEIRQMKEEYQQKDDQTRHLTDEIRKLGRTHDDVVTSEAYKLGVRIGQSPRLMKILKAMIK
jgi:uncharacterized coiled-coil DUF342 family protein